MKWENIVAIPSQRRYIVIIDDQIFLIEQKQLIEVIG